MNGRHLRVVVVGGGVGGLATAALLARCGASVTVLDEAAAGRDHGSALLLQPNGLAVLRALGVEERLVARGHRISSATVHGRTGRPLFEMTVPDCGEGLDHAACVRRSDLLTALREAAAAEPGVVLRRRVARRAGTTSPAAFVEDVTGHVEVADLVVGADGARSCVRASGRFGARGGATGRSYVRGLVATTGLPAAEHWSALGLFGGAAVGPGVGYFYCSADAPSVATALAVGDLTGFRHSWGRWVPAARPVLEAVDDLGDLLVNRAHDVRCDRWVDGRVVLLGDAAHPMEPTTGQGANSALVDAAELALALDCADSVLEAAARYQTRRRPVVTEAQRAAARVAALSAPRGALRARTRDTAVRALSSPRSLDRRARRALQVEPARLHHLLEGLGPTAPRPLA